MPKSSPKVKKILDFLDKRGSMQVLYEGINFDSKIIKMTTSCRGVLRGFHYQSQPFKQRKKIYVLDGEIQDVIIRVDEFGLPTGECVENIISSKNGLSELTIPEDWAHAYLTLSEKSRVLYVCDQVYGNEVSFNPIKFFKGWKICNKKLIISDKDLR